MCPRGLRMDGADGVGVIAAGGTYAERWVIRYVLEAMGLAGITEDTCGVNWLPTTGTPHPSLHFGYPA